MLFFETGLQHASEKKTGFLELFSPHQRAEKSSLKIREFRFFVDPDFFLGSILGPGRHGADQVLGVASKIEVHTHGATTLHTLQWLYSQNHSGLVSSSVVLSEPAEAQDVSFTVKNCLLGGTETSGRVSRFVVSGVEIQVEVESPLFVDPSPPSLAGPVASAPQPLLLLEEALQPLAYTAAPKFVADLPGPRAPQHVWKTLDILEGGSLRHGSLWGAGFPSRYASDPSELLKVYLQLEFQDPFPLEGLADPTAAFNSALGSQTWVYLLQNSGLSQRYAGPAGVHFRPAGPSGGAVDALALPFAVVHPDSFSRLSCEEVEARLWLFAEDQLDPDRVPCGLVESFSRASGSEGSLDLIQTVLAYSESPFVKKNIRAGDFLAVAFSDPEVDGSQTWVKVALTSVSVLLESVSHVRASLQFSLAGADPGLAFSAVHGSEVYLWNLAYEVGYTGGQRPLVRLTAASVRLAQTDPAGLPDFSLPSSSQEPGARTCLKALHPEAVEYLVSRTARVQPFPLLEAGAEVAGASGAPLDSFSLGSSTQGSSVSGFNSVQFLGASADLSGAPESTQGSWEVLFDAGSERVWRVVPRNFELGPDYLCAETSPDGQTWSAAVSENFLIPFQENHVSGRPQGCFPASSSSSPPGVFFTSSRFLRFHFSASASSLPGYGPSWEVCLFSERPVTEVVQLFPFPDLSGQQLSFEAGPLSAFGAPVRFTAGQENNSSSAGAGAFSAVFDAGADRQWDLTAQSFDFGPPVSDAASRGRLQVFKSTDGSGWEALAEKGWLLGPGQQIGPEGTAFPPVALPYIPESQGELGNIVLDPAPAQGGKEVFELSETAFAVFWKYFDLKYREMYFPWLSGAGGDGLFYYAEPEDRLVAYSVDHVAQTVSVSVRIRDWTSGSAAGPFTQDAEKSAYWATCPLDLSRFSAAPGNAALWEHYLPSGAEEIQAIEMQPAQGIFDYPWEAGVVEFPAGTEAGSAFEKFQGALAARFKELFYPWPAETGGDGRFYSFAVAQPWVKFTGNRPSWQSSEGKTGFQLEYRATRYVSQEESNSPEADSFFSFLVTVTPPGPPDLHGNTLPPVSGAGEFSGAPVSNRCVRLDRRFVMFSFTAGAAGYPLPEWEIFLDPVNRSADAAELRAGVGLKTGFWASARPLSVSASRVLSAVAPDLTPPPVPQGGPGWAFPLEVQLQNQDSVSSLDRVVLALGTEPSPRTGLPLDGSPLAVLLAADPSEAGPSAAAQIQGRSWVIRTHLQAWQLGAAVARPQIPGLQAGVSESLQIGGRQETAARVVPASVSGVAGLRTDPAVWALVEDPAAQAALGAELLQACRQAGALSAVSAVINIWRHRVCRDLLVFAAVSPLYQELVTAGQFQALCPSAFPTSRVAGLFSRKASFEQAVCHEVGLDPEKLQKEPFRAWFSNADFATQARSATGVGGKEASFGKTFFEVDLLNGRRAQVNRVLLFWNQQLAGEGLADAAARVSEFWLLGHRGGFLDTWELVSPGPVRIEWARAAQNGFVGSSPTIPLVSEGRTFQKFRLAVSKNQGSDYIELEQIALLFQHTQMYRATLEHASGLVLDPRVQGRLEDRSSSGHLQTLFCSPEKETGAFRTLPVTAWFPFQEVFPASQKEMFLYLLPVNSPASLDNLGPVFREGFRGSIEALRVRGAGPFGVEDGGKSLVLSPGPLWEWGQRVQLQPKGEKEDSLCSALSVQLSVPQKYQEDQACLVRVEELLSTGAWAPVGVSAGGNRAWEGGLPPPGDRAPVFKPDLDLGGAGVLALSAAADSAALLTGLEDGSAQLVFFDRQAGTGGLARRPGPAEVICQALSCDPGFLMLAADAALATLAARISGTEVVVRFPGPQETTQVLELPVGGAAATTTSPSALALSSRAQVLAAGLPLLENGEGRVLCWVRDPEKWEGDFGAGQPQVLAHPGSPGFGVSVALNGDGSALFAGSSNGVALFLAEGPGPVFGGVACSVQDPAEEGFGRHLSAGGAPDLPGVSELAVLVGGVSQAQLLRVALDPSGGGNRFFENVGTPLGPGLAAEGGPPVLLLGVGLDDLGSSAALRYDLPGGPAGCVQVFRFADEAQAFLSDAGESTPGPSWVQVGQPVQGLQGQGLALAGGGQAFAAASQVFYLRGSGAVGFLWDQEQGSEKLCRLSLEVKLPREVPVSRLAFRAYPADCRVSALASYSLPAPLLEQAEAAGRGPLPAPAGATPGRLQHMFFNDSAGPQVFQVDLETGEVTSAPLVTQVSTNSAEGGPVLFVRGPCQHVVLEGSAAQQAGLRRVVAFGGSVQDPGSRCSSAVLLGFREDIGSWEVLASSAADEMRLGVVFGDSFEAGTFVASGGFAQSPLVQGAGTTLLPVGYGRVLATCSVARLGLDRRVFSQFEAQVLLGCFGEEGANQVNSPRVFLFDNLKPGPGFSRLRVVATAFEVGERAVFGAVQRTFTFAGVALALVPGGTSAEDGFSLPLQQLSAVYPRPVAIESARFGRSWAWASSSSSGSSAGPGRAFRDFVLFLEKPCQLRALEANSSKTRFFVQGGSLRQRLLQKKISDQTSLTFQIIVNKIFGASNAMQDVLKELGLVSEEEKNIVEFEYTWIQTYNFDWFINVSKSLYTIMITCRVRKVNEIRNMGFTYLHASRMAASVAEKIKGMAPANPRGAFFLRDSKNALFGKHGNLAYLRENWASRFSHLGTFDYYKPVHADGSEIDMETTLVEGNEEFIRSALSVLSVPEGDLQALQEFLGDLSGQTYDYQAGELPGTFSVFVSDPEAPGGLDLVRALRHAFGSPDLNPNNGLWLFQEGLEEAAAIKAGSQKVQKVTALSGSSRTLLLENFSLWASDPSSAQGLTPRRAELAGGRGANWLFFRVSGLQEEGGDYLPDLQLALETLESPGALNLLHADPPSPSPLRFPAVVWESPDPRSRYWERSPEEQGLFQVSFGQLSGHEEELRFWFSAEDLAVDSKCVHEFILGGPGASPAASFEVQKLSSGLVAEEIFSSGGSWGIKTFAPLFGHAGGFRVTLKPLLGGPPLRPVVRSYPAAGNSPTASCGGLAFLELFSSASSSSSTSSSSSSVLLAQKAEEVSHRALAGLEPLGSLGAEARNFPVLATPALTSSAGDRGFLVSAPGKTLGTRPYSVFSQPYGVEVPGGGGPKHLICAFPAQARASLLQEGGGEVGLDFLQIDLPRAEELREVRLRFNASSGFPGRSAGQRIDSLAVLGSNSPEAGAAVWHILAPAAQLAWRPDPGQGPGFEVAEVLPLGDAGGAPQAFRYFRLAVESSAAAGPTWAVDGVEILVAPQQTFEHSAAESGQLLVGERLQGAGLRGLDRVTELQLSQPVVIHSLELRATLLRASQEDLSGLLVEFASPGDPEKWVPLAEFASQERAGGLLFPGGEGRAEPFQTCFPFGVFPTAGGLPDRVFLPCASSQTLVLASPVEASALRFTPGPPPSAVKFNPLYSEARVSPLGAVSSAAVALLFPDGLQAPAAAGEPFQGLAALFSDSGALAALSLETACLVVGTPAGYQAGDAVLHVAGSLQNSPDAPWVPLDSRFEIEEVRVTDEVEEVPIPGALAGLMPGGGLTTTALPGAEPSPGFSRRKTVFRVLLKPGLARTSFFRVHACVLRFDAAKFQPGAFRALSFEAAGPRLAQEAGAMLPEELEPGFGFGGFEQALDPFALAPRNPRFFGPGLRSAAVPQTTCSFSVGFSGQHQPRLANCRKLDQVVLRQRLPANASDGSASFGRPNALSVFGVQEGGPGAGETLLYRNSDLQSTTNGTTGAGGWAVRVLGSGSEGLEEEDSDVVFVAQIDPQAGGGRAFQKYRFEMASARDLWFFVLEGVQLVFAPELFPYVPRSPAEVLEAGFSPREGPLDPLEPGVFELDLAQFSACWATFSARFAELLGPSSADGRFYRLLQPKTRQVYFEDLSGAAEQQQQIRCSLRAAVLVSESGEEGSFEELAGGAGSEVWAVVAFSAAQQDTEVVDLAVPNFAGASKVLGSEVPDEGSEEANFCMANLFSSDLSQKHLSRANFRFATLRETRLPPDLSQAILKGAVVFSVEPPQAASEGGASLPQGYYYAEVPASPVRPGVKFVIRGDDLDPGPRDADWAELGFSKAQKKRLLTFAPASGQGEVLPGLQEEMGAFFRAAVESCVPGQETRMVHYLVDEILQACSQRCGDTSSQESAYFICQLEALNLGHLSPTGATTTVRVVRPGSHIPMDQLLESRDCSIYCPVSSVSSVRVVLGDSQFLDLTVFENSLGELVAKVRDVQTTSTSEGAKETVVFQTQNEGMDLFVGQELSASEQMQIRQEGVGGSSPYVFNLRMSGSVFVENAESAGVLDVYLDADGVPDLYDSAELVFQYGETYYFDLSLLAGEGYLKLVGLSGAVFESETVPAADFGEGDVWYVELPPSVLPGSLSLNYLPDLAEGTEEVVSFSFSVNPSVSISGEDPSVSVSGEDPSVSVSGEDPSVPISGEGSAVGDPYVTNCLGQWFKLPKKRQTYRLLQTSDFLVDAEVNVLPSKFAERLKLMQDHFRKDHPGATMGRGFKIDGFYFCGFKITNLKKGVCTYLDAFGNFAAGARQLKVFSKKETQAMFCPLQGFSLFTKKFLFLNGTKFSIFQYQNPQIFNGVSIKLAGRRGGERSADVPSGLLVEGHYRNWACKHQEWKRVSKRLGLQHRWRSAVKMDMSQEKKKFVKQKNLKNYRQVRT